MLKHSNGVNVVASDEFDLTESASIRLISERDDEDGDEDEELDAKEEEGDESSDDELVVCEALELFDESFRSADCECDCPDGRDDALEDDTDIERRFSRLFISGSSCS
jgi:hypothetical protein